MLKREAGPTQRDWYHGIQTWLKMKEKKPGLTKTAFLKSEASGGLQYNKSCQNLFPKKLKAFNEGKFKKLMSTGLEGENIMHLKQSLSRMLTPYHKCTRLISVVFPGSG